MNILDHIILGDGPVSTVLQAAIASQGKDCLVLDCGPNLKDLLDRLVVESNLNYLAKSRAPSLNRFGSDFMWAGGLQGWPEEDWSPNRNSGLPGTILRDQFISASREIKRLLGIRNFDFNRDLPTYSVRKFNRLQYSNLRMIFCKALTDPRMQNLRLRNESNRFIHHIDSFIAIKIVPHPDFVRIEGISTFDGSSVHFECKRLHLALGTIENTRLLLNSRNDLDLVENKFLGRYLSDHLTFKWGTYSTQNLPRVIRHFSQLKTFDGNLIWPRVKLNEDQNVKNISSFAHVDGFLFDQGLPIFYRVLRRLRMEHLYFSPAKSGKFDLNLFVEKMNQETNGMEIADSDGLEIPRAKIKFNLNNGELSTISELSAEMEAAFRLVFPDIRKVKECAGDELSPEDIQAGTHASGTYRMSQSHEDGVVNQRSELWSDNRIRVLGAGAFPVASATHPTFTSMVLALIGVHSS